MIKGNLASDDPLEPYKKLSEWKQEVPSDQGTLVP